MQKKVFFQNFLVFVLFASVNLFSEQSLLKHGDFIFQNLNSSFADSVSSSTHSVWSHVGVIVTTGEKLMVLEATLPVVKLTSLDRFIKTANSRIGIVRFPDLTTSEIEIMISRGFSHINKPYDRLFILKNTQSLYCSELVYDMINFVRPGYVSSNPMDFTASWDYWEKWFAPNPVPQGLPGISPEDIYMHPDAEKIWDYRDQNTNVLSVFNFSSLYKFLGESQ